MDWNPKVLQPHPTFLSSSNRFLIPNVHHSPLASRSKMISSRVSLSGRRILSSSSKLSRRLTRPVVVGNASHGLLSRPLFFAQHSSYTTERILESRRGKGKEPVSTLYKADNEKENCGVGLIASLKSNPSRDIVVKADEMLVRMSHRGGFGCDPCSGDGSGM